MKGIYSVLAAVIMMTQFSFADSGTGYFYEDDAPVLGASMLFDADAENAVAPLRKVSSEKDLRHLSDDSDTEEEDNPQVRSSGSGAKSSSWFSAGVALVKKAFRFALSCFGW